MKYLLWALVALLAYSFVAPLVNLAASSIPSNVVALVSNGVLAIVVLTLVLLTEDAVVPHLTAPESIYMYAAGLFLSVGILGYYRALSLGPVSVVVPIFGLFIVTSSLLGVVFLEESLTARKLVGIVFAVVAIVLTSGGQG